MRCERQTLVRAKDSAKVEIWQRGPAAFAKLRRATPKPGGRRREGPIPRA
jgi:hypothetical protein